MLSRGKRILNILSQQNDEKTSKIKYSSDGNIHNHNITRKYLKAYETSSEIVAVKKLPSLGRYCINNGSSFNIFK